MLVEYRFKMGLSPIVDGRHTMEFDVMSNFNSDFSADYGATPNLAYPIYGNDLSKEYEREGDSFRFREGLSGRLLFVGKDFDAIKAMTLDDIMLLDVEMSVDGGSTWATYHRGFFAKTDCEFDYDNRRVEVELDTLDGYTDIIKGLDKEYDLIKLAPKVTNLTFVKRPLLQIYALGDSKVTCYMGASSWEVDALVMPTTDTAVREYGFTLAGRQRGVVVKGISSEADGVYFGAVWNVDDTLYSTLRGDFIKKGSSEFYMTYRYEYRNGYFFPNIVIYNNGTEVASYVSEVTGYSGELPTFNIGEGSAGVVKSDFYSRVLTDVEDVATSEVKAEDIVADLGYNRVLPWAMDSSVIYASPLYSEEPTEWGTSVFGDYFVKPDNLAGGVHPLAASTWKYTSYWLVNPYEWEELDVNASKEYRLRHAYPLYAVIQRLLAEIAPGITFEPDNAHSEFLYGRGGDIRIDDWQLYITPKSNMVNGEYQLPAQRATITLQQIFEMLQNVYQLYWVVDGDKLRIEHIEYFREGASYEPDFSVAVDLAAAVNPRTGKTWADGQSNVTFSRSELPERYEFAWMDEVTDAFKGQPIEILSPSVERGKVESVTIGNFTSDIDYVLQNPTAISSEGFMLLAAATKPFIESSATITSADDRVEIEPKPYARYADMVVSSTMTENCRIVVYEGDVVVWQSGYFRPSTASYLGVYIPADATAIGFVSITSVSPPRLTINSLAPSNEAQVSMLKMGDYTYQNGYASFQYILPRFWTYDLPSKKVKINGEEQVLGQTKKAARQTVVFPSAADLNPLKLVRTNIGDGQVMRVSVTLRSRRIEAELAYDL